MLISLLFSYCDSMEGLYDRFLRVAQRSIEINNVVYYERYDWSVESAELRLLKDAFVIHFSIVYLN